MLGRPRDQVVLGEWRAKHAGGNRRSEVGQHGCDIDAGNHRLDQGPVALKEGHQPTVEGRLAPTDLLLAGTGKQLPRTRAEPGAIRSADGVRFGHVHRQDRGVAATELRPGSVPSTGSR